MTEAILKLKHLVRRGREHSLGAGDLCLLLQLYGEPAGLSMGAICRLLAFSSAAATLKVDKLTARGLTSRRPGLADQRKVYALLAPAGEELLKKITTIP